jgi:hypothetical protein
VTVRYVQKEAQECVWSRRLALFFVQLLILTVILHRLGGVSTPVAMNLLAVGVIGLVAAIVLAFSGLGRIWFGGQLGASEAVAGILVAIAGLALPIWFISQFATLPALTNVDTSPRAPTTFRRLASLRPADANRLEEPDEEAVKLQEVAYPDIRTMELERSATEVFDLVLEAVRRLEWNIEMSEAPRDAPAGRIEATDRTMIMGFTDDVVVTVTGDDTHALVNVRSVSRYGPHDLGANATRIRTLFAEVKTALEKGEKTGLEQAAKPKPEPKKAVKTTVKKKTVKKKRRPKKAVKTTVKKKTVKKKRRRRVRRRSAR